jgi:hypothetical protein
VLGWPKNALKWVLASISGADPEPRAWDRLFSKHRTGYITLKLKDNGEWKAGLWYAPSYASAYGEDQDLYIAEQIAVDDAGCRRSPNSPGLRSGNSSGGGSWMMFYPMSSFGWVFGWLLVPGRLWGR